MSYTKQDKLSKTENKIFEKLKHIIIYYLYENPLEPINHVDIKRELSELNDFFDEANRENPESLRIILERYKRKMNNEKNSDDTKSNSGKSGNDNVSNTETAKLIQFFSSSYSKNKVKNQKQLYNNIYIHSILLYRIISYYIVLYRIQNKIIIIYFYN